MESANDSPDQIFAIDIGATSIKFCRVNERGELLESPQRRPTPYPCSPSRLVGTLSERITKSGCTRVGVGFPGDFAEGHVIRPGNLSRPGGVNTDIDPELEAQWVGFDLEGELRAATNLDVRVINDASLAALGCATGTGTELVLTLGTGCGLALVRDGQLVRVRDVGSAPFGDGRTYDQAIGEPAREDNEAVWLVSLEKAILGFIDEFDATRVFLGGGNGRRVSPASLHVPVEVIISGNEASLSGAAKLFSPERDRPRTR